MTLDTWDRHLNALYRRWELGLLSEAARLDGMRRLRALLFAIERGEE